MVLPIKGATMTIFMDDLPALEGLYSVEGLPLDNSVTRGSAMWWVGLALAREIVITPNGTNDALQMRSRLHVGRHHRAQRGAVQRVRH